MAVELATPLVGPIPTVVATAASDVQSGGFVAFSDVEKSYDGRTLVVKRLNLSVARGEFLTLLGPSGSGKTTILNMLAGFERPTRGTISLDGRPVDRLPPYERNIGMVFQNYALFPHMTAAENVAFPLSVRNIGKADIASRVSNALDMVRLGPFADRKPARLSGGQQQRVALARCFVYQPSIHPDGRAARLRQEAARAHAARDPPAAPWRPATTIVYVTHDQEEALAMSNRVAVFNNGGIAQLGSPDDLYARPQSAFVADFIGEKNNTLHGIAATVSDGRCKVRLDGGGEIQASSIGAVEGAACQVVVRPERLRLAADSGTGENLFQATMAGRAISATICGCSRSCRTGRSSPSRSSPTPVRETARR